MKFLSFGEVLLRIATPSNETFGPTTNGQFYFGGAELNVAIALSGLGIESSWISVLPDSELGIVVKDLINKKGVNTEHVRYGEGSMACYFLENGSGERPTKVLDRIPGPLRNDEREMFYWDIALKGVDHFHTTGISSGLNQKTLEDVTRALTIAKKLGIQTSYDFNYRGKLWSFSEAKTKQAPLFEHIDLLFGGIGDLDQMLGIKIDESKDPKDYQKEVFSKYTFKEVIISERRDGQYRVFAMTENEVEVSPWQNLSGIDRIGTGDAMTAGYLYSKSKGESLCERVKTAALMGAIKDSYPGDFLDISQSQLKRWTENKEHWR